MPCCRKGVTTMKIIRSTSMISTIGVTLISDVKPPPPPACIPIVKTPFAAPKTARARSQPENPRADFGFRRSELRIQLLGAVLDEIINQLGSRVIHLNNKAVHLACEVVEQPHRRNRDHESERRGEQCFRNTTRNGRDTR